MCTRLNITNVSHLTNNKPSNLYFHVKVSFFASHLHSPWYNETSLIV